MKSTKKTSKRKRDSNGRIPVRLYFQDDNEIAMVRRAAERRGVGYNEFMLRAVLNASSIALAAPPDPIFGPRPAVSPDLLEEAS